MNVYANPGSMSNDPYSGQGPINPTSAASAGPLALLSVAVFVAGVLTVLLRQDILDPGGLAACVGWGIVLLCAAAGGIRLAAERDVVSWRTLLDAVILTGAIGLFNWMFPRFRTGARTGDASERLYLTMLGFGWGALLAAIVILGLIRRPPNAASSFYLGSLGLLLAAYLVAPTRLLLSAALIGLAFVALAFSWSARANGEPGWTPPKARLRIPRWVLSLAAAGVAGSAVEAALGDNAPKQSLIAYGLAGLVVLLAIASAVFSRRDVVEEGAFEDWLSQERDQHSADFEATPNEYLPQPSRPLSEWSRFGELRLADDSFWSTLGVPPQTDFHFGSIAHPEDRAALALALSQSIGHGYPMQHAFRAVDPFSGRERMVQLNAVPSEAGTVLIEAHRIDKGPAAFRSKASRLPGFDDPTLRNAINGLRNTNFVDTWLKRYATENRRHTDTATLVIIESMPLAEHDALSGARRDLITTAVGHHLDAECRTGDFLAHLDGPYFLFGARLPVPGDRQGLLDRIAMLLTVPPMVDPPFSLDFRMVTLNVEPGVDLTRVLGVAAAAFTEL